MIRAAVLGATGYAGAELVRILAGHPDVKLTLLTSRQYEGQPFERIFPAMTGHVDLQCESYSLDRVSESADVIFTALPHKLPMSIVPELHQRGKKIVDLSADFRFKDAAAYETAYQQHTAKDLLESAVYGLSEVFSDKLKTASLVGNPGCYPTSVLLPLIPLFKKRWIDEATIVADAKSGVSGAGRNPVVATHFCEVTESFRAYKVASHRHNPEMDEILTLEAGRPVAITFVPHLVPMSRGMLATIYANLTQKLRNEEIRQCFEAFYADRRFIRLREDGQFPDTRQVRGTNYCDIGFRIDLRHQRIILMAAIDNLVKGAAGQAVQNMNIMMGLNETTGLILPPYPF